MIFEKQDFFNIDEVFKVARKAVSHDERQLISLIDLRKDHIEKMAKANDPKKAKK